MIDDILNSANLMASAVTGTSNPVLVKRLYIGFIIFLYHAVCFYSWHKNYYGTSTLWYIIMYLFTVTFVALVYRSIQRYKSREL
jgi:hypothetical protein